MPELLATVGGTREIARWAAYLEEYPPDEAEWNRAAMIGYCAANGQKFRKAVRMDDLKPKIRRVQTPAQQIRMLKGLSGNKHG